LRRWIPFNIFGENIPYLSEIRGSSLQTAAPAA
jgi:hypothetical protein